MLRKYFSKVMRLQKKKSLLSIGTTYSRMMAISSRYKQSNYKRFTNKNKYFNPQKILWTTASLFSFGYLWEQYRRYSKSSSECWGIIGYIGNENIAEKVVLDGIQILQYRGYDSWGIVTVNSEGNFVLHKKSSSSGQGGDCIEKVLEEAKGKHEHLIGIGHTRWATHGGKTDLNAHPHFDLDERFAVVHNGMIENYLEIKEKMREKGIEQKTQTDTELIALYTKFLVDTEGLSTEDAFRKCFQHMEGSNWWLLIDKTQPDRIYAAKNAGSLLIGIGEKGFVISSQVSAFQHFTRRYIQVPNNEVVVITKEEILRKDKVLNKDDIKTLRKEIIDKKPKPGFKWFFEQEIFEQPEAISKVLNYGARIAGNNKVKLGGLDAREDDLKSIDNLVIAAWGTSLYAGMYGALMMRKFHCFDSITPYSASDITEDYFIPKNSALLSITQSGETEDVKKAIRLAQSRGIIWFNIINEVESEIARMTELGVFVNAGREVSVASSKAFICQAVAAWLITAWFAEHKHPNKLTLERIELLENLKVLWMKAQETINETKFEMEEVAKSLNNMNYWAILGKGLCEPIAKEAALKIKEITYLHAEGYSSGEFKHGPLALIEENKKTAGIIFIFDDENFDFNLSILAQLRAKQAYTIVITNWRNKIADEWADCFIKIPSWGDLTPLLGIIPIQLIALHLAEIRGNDVDKPRNLSKTVTV